MQHWTGVMGRARRVMMEHLAAQIGEAAANARSSGRPPGRNMFSDPAS
jgi:hypothetical protein